MEGSKTVLLVGTLDTKGAEYAYLRERLRLHGVEAILADAGVGENRVHAVQAQALAKVRVLCSLGVERPDEQDRLRALHALLPSLDRRDPTETTASGAWNLMIGCRNA